MTTKRLLLGILAVFVTIFATDFLIHGLWMSPVYKATANLWRPEAEMSSHMGWLMGGQFLAAATFVMIWSKGFSDRSCMKSAVMYGLCMGLFSQAQTLISYAVSPLTPEIVGKWFVAGTLQGAIAGIVVFYVCQPAAQSA